MGLSVVDMIYLWLCFYHREKIKMLGNKSYKLPDNFKLH